MKLPIILDNPKCLPEYAHPGDAGADLKANLETAIMIYTGQTVAVDTGIKVAVPDGYELQIRSRSGLAKHGIVVANSPGTIDAGYRGPG